MSNSIINSVSLAKALPERAHEALKRLIVFLSKSDRIRITGRLCRRRTPDGDQRWSWKRTMIPQVLRLDREVNPHIAIVGESGSGKSNACMALLEMLGSRDAGFAVLDTSDEYVGLAGRLGARVYNCARSGINIFELDGLSAREKTSDLVLMFTRHFKLGQYQASVLNRCLRYMYDGTERFQAHSMQSLMGVIAIFRNHADSRESAALQTIRDRLGMIYSSSVRDSIDMGSVLKGSSVFAMSELHTAESQAIFMEGFLRKLYSTMLEKRQRPGGMFYVVVEEAAKLGESAILSRVVSEGRKYGIGIIAIAQSSKGLARDVRVNSSVFMSLYQREPEELNYVANFIAGGNEGHRFIEVKKALRTLGRHCAVVSMHGSREPITARFPIVQRGRDNAEYRIAELSKDGISRGELLRKLYSRRINYADACAAIEMLLKNGTIQRHIVEGCGEHDGTWYIAKPRNSARHDIMVAIISRELAEKGVGNRIYNGPNGPDIVASIEGENVAYEYESGSKSRKDVLEMLERRRRQYKTILVIANPAAAARYAPLEGVRLIDEHEFFS